MIVQTLPVLNKKGCSRFCRSSYDHLMRFFSSLHRHYSALAQHSSTDALEIKCSNTDSSGRSTFRAWAATVTNQCFLCRWQTVCARAETPFSFAKATCLLTSPRSSWQPQPHKGGSAFPVMAATAASAKRLCKLKAETGASFDDHRLGQRGCGYVC